MKVLEQTKEYNCAVFSLNFLLGLYGVKTDTEELEKIIGTTEENGTSHEDIKKGIRYFNLKYISYDDSHVSTLEEFLPAIINYQYCDADGYDGHYSVVLGKGHGFFTVYNPAIGEIEIINEKKLQENWYSERYGKGWFIQIVNPELNGDEFKK